MESVLCCIVCVREETESPSTEFIVKKNRSSKNTLMGPTRAIGK